MKIILSSLTPDTESLTKNEIGWKGSLTIVSQGLRPVSVGGSSSRTIVALSVSNALQLKISLGDGISIDKVSSANEVDNPAMLFYL